MIIKCGRNEFDLNKDDVIFDNGACFQILTRSIRSGWSEYSPILAQGKAKTLIKNGDLVLVKEKLSHLTKDGKEMRHRYYKIKES